MGVVWWCVGGEVGESGGGVGLGGCWCGWLFLVV